jgi:hypothetical protein
VSGSESVVASAATSIDWPARHILTVGFHDLLGAVTMYTVKKSQADSFGHLAGFLVGDMLQTLPASKDAQRRKIWRIPRRTEPFDRSLGCSFVALVGTGRRAYQHY